MDRWLAPRDFPWSAHTPSLARQAVRAALDAGAPGREINEVCLDRLRDLGAPNGELVTWLNYARQR